MSSSDIFGGGLAELLRFAGVQHAVWKEVSYKRCFREEMLRFSIQRVAPNLASQALRNDGCGTASRHARIMFESSHCN